MAKFRVRNGIDGPREPAARVQCPKCNNALGVEVRAELVEVWIAPDMTGDGTLVGGRKVWVCGRCRIRGEWTPIGAAETE